MLHGSTIKALDIWTSILLLLLLLVLVPQNAAFTRVTEIHGITPYDLFPAAYNNAEEPAVFFRSLLPEDVRFAKLRCLEHYPRANLNWTTQSNMNELVAQDTHCYVKCFLRHLGLIDLQTLGWNFFRIIGIWRNLRGTLLQDSPCAGILEKGEYLSGKCVDYYNQWMALHDACYLLFRDTFYDHIEPKKIVFIIPPSKFRQRGVRAIEFCTTHLREVHKMSLILLCVYQHFHYFDCYGRVDSNEISRSFAEANRLTAQSDDLIKECAHRANSLFQLEQNGVAMAKELYECLRKSMPKIYPIVHMHRNKMTEQY